MTTTPHAWTIEPVELGWRGDPAELVAAADDSDVDARLAARLRQLLPAWHAGAACRQPEHRHLDFLASGRGQRTTKLWAVCRRCPVRDACLEEAIADPELVGYWGGTTPAERLAERVRRRRENETSARPQRRPSTGAQP